MSLLADLATVLPGRKRGSGNRRSGVRRALPINSLEKSSVLLADLPGLLEDPGALPVEAAEVVLDIPDIKLEVLPKDALIVELRLAVVRQVRPKRSDASLGSRVSASKKEQKYSPRAARAAQPEGAQASRNLD